MRICLGFVLAAALAGCHSVADVRSLHADRYLVEGAAVVPRDEGSKAIDHRTDVEISAGDHAILLVEDGGEIPGAVDSGNAEFLLIEFPTLQRDASWPISPCGAHTWMWHGGAWGSAELEEAGGTIALDTEDARTWTVRVDLRGRMNSHGPKEAKEVHLLHNFMLTPMTFKEFDKREAYIWTRRR